MRKIIIMFVAVCLCSSSLGYSVAPSRQVAHYHYTPPQGPRLELPIHSTDSNQNYQPQNQRSYRQQYSQQTQQNVPQTVAFTSQGYNSAASTMSDHSGQESIRLPLPLGVASINVGPLPLSEGTSYSSRPGITSYGTPYPQRV